MRAFRTSRAAWPGPQSLLGINVVGEIARVDWHAGAVDSQSGAEEAVPGDTTVYKAGWNKWLGVASY